MCKTRMAIDAVPPTNRKSKTPRSRSSPSSSQPSTPTTTTTATAASTTTPNGVATPSSSSSSSHSLYSSRRSLASLRSSLPDNPHLYDISDIRFATNNFLSMATPSNSSRSWRCSLNGKDVIIFQRKSHDRNLSKSTVRKKLLSICKSHHVAIVNLQGAAISDSDYMYLVYEFVNGASLTDLLHNPNNPDFTVLSTWMSRMQIATDIANGLDYIHNSTGLDMKFVHNHIKSSSVVVTEGSVNAKFCHFGTAELCGEPTEEREKGPIDEVVAEMNTDLQPKVLARSNSFKFSGTRGYMAPEFQTTGIGTRKTDVYALGVVLLELLSGEEPVKYKFNKKTKEYTRVSITESATSVVGDRGGDWEAMLRKWVDRRLRDSFPVEVAEKMIKLAVDCVHVDPSRRPDTRRVAGKISKLYLESRAWCDRMSVPTEFTVSFAPR